MCSLISLDNSKAVSWSSSASHKHNAANENKPSGSPPITTPCPNSSCGIIKISMLPFVFGVSVFIKMRAAVHRFLLSLIVRDLKEMIANPGVNTLTWACWGLALWLGIRVVSDISKIMWPKSVRRADYRSFSLRWSAAAGAGASRNRL